MKKVISCLCGAGVLAALLVANAVPGKAAGNAEKGKETFEQCSVCHNVDTDEKKMGPSLKGLFKRERLLESRS